MKCNNFYLSTEGCRGPGSDMEDVKNSHTRPSREVLLLPHPRHQKTGMEGGCLKMSEGILGVPEMNTPVSQPPKFKKVHKEEMVTQTTDTK